MKRSRPPITSKGDMAFMRGLVENSREVASLRNIASRIVKDMRDRVAHRTVNALYARYRRYMRNIEDAPGFQSWLIERAVLENTYLYHQLMIRQRWVRAPIMAAMRKEMSLDGVTERPAWYYEHITILIRLKDPGSGVCIVATAHESSNEETGKGPTVLFQRRDHRFIDEDCCDLNRSA
jgi:hypothetical protein